MPYNNYSLAKPPPLRLPTDAAVSTRQHTRSHSRASPTRPRLTDADGLLADLSPSSTLAALCDGTQSFASGKLKASIEAASVGEREFGIRAATAGKKIKEWFNELQDWPWPESGSAGFETPQAKLKKLPAVDDLSSATPEEPHTVDQEEMFFGSLPAKEVERYSERINEILDDMDDLDVEEIKSHILDLHIPSRSRPSSSASGSPTRMPNFLSYSKMEDFTAVITATVLQTLPTLARLQILMDVWTTRLVALRQISPFMDAMDDAEAAVRFGWNAVNSSGTIAAGEANGGATAKDERVSLDALNTIQKSLQDKVTRAGQKLDRILDSLEGKQDTIPEAWLDRMEILERSYANLVAVGHRKALKDAWAMQNHSRNEPLEPAEKGGSEPAKTPRAITANGDPSTFGLSEARLAGKDRVINPSDELGDSPKRSSLSAGYLVLPENSPPLISQIDGAQEVGRDTLSSEPVTPRTPQTPSPASRSNVRRKLFSSPPSLNCSLSSLPDHVVAAEQSCSDSESRCGPESPVELEYEAVDGQSQIPRERNLTPGSSRETVVKHEFKRSPETPGKPTDEVQDRTSPNSLRSYMLQGDETVGTGKSSRDPPETPTDFDLTPSIISTSSSITTSDSSPVLTRHTRHVLSPIQSSLDWFDFGDEQTPTKDPLGRDYKSSNFSTKQDGQKTPTPNVGLGLLHTTLSDCNRSDDKTHENKENSVKGGGFEKVDIGAEHTTLTPDHPIASFASVDGNSPPSTSNRNTELLESPDFSNFNIKTAKTSLEPPMLPNVGVLQAPDLFSPTKGSAAQLQQQISEILESLPTKIHFTTERERNVSSELKVPKRLKKTVSASSLRLPSRSSTPGPTFTLAPAYGKNSSRLRHHANSEIKLYHLSRSNGGAPIKLFVRLVGENGERVMVRVGGGWADLGEYLREYALHHSRRNAPEDQIQIHDSSSRIVSSSSITSARSGGLSSPGRSVTSLDHRPATSAGNHRPYMQNERPGSSLAMRKTRHPRQSFGDEVRDARQRLPSTPLPVMNRSHRSGSASLLDTPPSATSTTGSRSSSRLDFGGEDGNLGLSGPRSKKVELSEESERWVESMTEKVKKASAEKEKKHMMGPLGEIGTAGSTKRLFKRN